MGKNRWQNAETWPLQQTQWQRWFLHSEGDANTRHGDGSVNTEKPGKEPPDMFVYNPQNPVPTRGGRVLPISGLVPGPINQSEIEERRDVLCFTSRELQEHLEVTGPIELHLFASTSAKDTDFTAKLIDVFPDGQAYNVAEGIIRARYRKSIFDPELVTPGKVYPFVINMGNISQLFPAGHRLQLDISSSNFPAFDRNMNTGKEIGQDSESVPATQKVYHDRELTSYLDLPVVPAK